MRKILRTFLASTILAFYIMVSFGITIHECRKSGSVDVIFFSYNGNCGIIHHNCGCYNHKTCCGNHHVSGCCQITVHHIDHDYNVATNYYGLTSMQDLIMLMAYLPSGLTAEYPEVELNRPPSCNSSPPLPYLKSYSFYSQWRL